MSKALRPDGEPVTLEGVTIVSPGLRGNVDVLPAAAPGLRGADSATDALVAALEATDMREQRTIVISDHSVDSYALGGGISRSTQHGEPALALTVPGPGTGMGQVLLAVDEAGVVSWVLPDDVPASEAATRGGDTRTYTVPIEVAETAGTADSGQRGLVAIIGKKLLKVLAYELLEDVAGKLAGHFAARWEADHHPYRLRPFDPGGYRGQDARSLTAADLAPYQRAPVLLLIHGEMNLSHTGFSQLPPDVLRGLHDRYEGRVLAFDHPTISATPTENAAWLAGLVRGAGLTVDIVAHSRGGLVARALAEQPDSAGLPRDSLRVRRLIMAGTPNQGTALASTNGLNYWVDRVTSMLDVIPDIPVIETLNIVISVVKQIAVGAYDGLDGIAAMRPGGPWLTELNKPSPAAAAYHAISSDYAPAEGAPLARVARDRVTDLIFRNAGNDLIVPEASVYGRNGAAAFPIAAPLTLTAGQSVDHFSYWGCTAVHDKLGQWLAP
jgi:hypothetical protein